MASGSSSIRGAIPQAPFSMAPASNGSPWKPVRSKHFTSRAMGLAVVLLPAIQRMAGSSLSSVHGTPSHRSSTRHGIGREFSFARKGLEGLNSWKPPTCHLPLPLGRYVVARTSMYGAPMGFGSASPTKTISWPTVRLCPATKSTRGMSACAFL